MGSAFIRQMEDGCPWPQQAPGNNRGLWGVVSVINRGDSNLIVSCGLRVKDEDTKGQRMNWEMMANNTAWRKQRRQVSGGRREKNFFSFFFPCTFSTSPSPPPPLVSHPDLFRSGCCRGCTLSYMSCVSSVLDWWDADERWNVIVLLKQSKSKIRNIFHD